MRSIKPELTDSFLKAKIDVNKLSSSEPLLVASFTDLVLEIAKLSYANKDFLLFFRGQKGDYKNKKGGSTFYPGIYRGDYVLASDLKNKFTILDTSSNSLVEARRPYFQEGYLAATDDITWNYENKNELDFNNRLIGKFKFRNEHNFWNDGNKSIPKNFLYPEEDPVFDLCLQIKDQVSKELSSGDLGDFLKEWAAIEQAISDYVRKETQRFFPLGKALEYMYSKNLIGKDLMIILDNLRRFRNQIVHTPHTVSTLEVLKYSELLNVAIISLAAVKELNFAKGRQ